MFYVFILLFVLLCLSLLFSVIKEGRFKTWARIFRIAVVFASVVFFIYFFTAKSVTPFLKNSLAVQLVNKLPFPLDFYIVQVNDSTSAAKYKARPVGKIRTDYYRIEYLDMSKSNEFWIAGYVGKKNLAYFSQHSVPNKNVDQIIEVDNYINQSAKLSGTAKTLIEGMKFENVKTAIWITLDLLLLFLNAALLLRKERTRKIPV